MKNPLLPIRCRSDEPDEPFRISGEPLVMRKIRKTWRLLLRALSSKTLGRVGPSGKWIRPRITTYTSAAELKKEAPDIHAVLEARGLIVDGDFIFPGVTDADR